MKKSCRNRLTSLGLALCMLLTLTPFSIGVSAEEDTPTGINMEVHSQTLGGPLTSFANEDAIKLCLSLSDTAQLNSVFVRPAGGGDDIFLYLDPANVQYFTGDGLWGILFDQGMRETIWDDDTPTAGDLIPPGAYRFLVYDDQNPGGGSYLSNATYTVTPGGGDPGGDQGIYNCRAFFSENGQGELLAESSCAFYLYTTEPIGAGDTASATLHYNSDETDEVTLSGSVGGYVFSAGDVLPADAVSVEKVTFTLGEVTRDFLVGKDVAASLTVDFSGAAGEGLVKYLRISGADDFTASYFLGTPATPNPMTISLPTGVYDVSVVGSLLGREVTFGTADDMTVSAGKTEETMILTDITPTRVTPAVLDGDGGTLPSYCYNLKWYDAENGGNLVYTGPGYALLADETLYVEAVPAGHYATRYQVSPREAVTDGGVTLTLTAHEQKTVTGTVTKADGSTPLVSAQVTVTNTVDGYAFTQSTTTGADGTFTLQTPILPGATLTASRYDLTTAISEGFDADTYTNLNLTMAQRQGVITLPDGYADSALVQDGDGNPLAHTFADRRRYLYLSDPDDVTGPLSIRLNSVSRQAYLDAQVTLDGQACGVIEQTPWINRGQASFTLQNPNRVECYGLLYDHNGALLSTETRYGLASTNTTIHYNGAYLDEGDYTYLFVRKDAWQQLGTLQDGSLTETKAALTALGNGFYVAQAVTISDDTQSAFSLTLPTGVPPSSPVNLEASGLTLEADADTVRVRVTAALKNPAATETSLTLDLVTNQESDSGGQNANLINGSLYINGKKAGSDVQITPDSSTASSFDGTYQIIIPDVTLYGGWPVTLQWQSNRTNLDSVSATALLSLNSVGGYHYLDSDFLNTPALTLCAPQAVAAADFNVYGYGPKGSTVTLSLDGTTAATLKAHETTGFYSAALSLGKPFGPSHHKVTATATTPGDGTVSSPPQSLRYNASLPVLSKIEFTDYRSNWVTAWEDGLAWGSSYYWYLPGTPMKYKLTFRNAEGATAMEQVTVYLPRADGVEKLEATYSGNGTWTTSPYLCGNNPPTGAWVGYLPAEPDSQLTQEEYDNFSALLTEENAFAATEGQQTVVNNQLAGTGVAINWDNGKPTSASLTFGPENTYTFSLSRVEGTGAATAIAAFPTMPQGAALAAAVSGGAMFLDPTTNTPYAKLGVVDGVYTIDQVSRYDAGSGEIWERQVMTMNSLTRTICDTYQDTVVTLTYTNTGRPIREPSRDHMAKMTELLSVWAAFYTALDQAASGTLDHGPAPAPFARLMALGVTVADVQVPQGPPPPPPSGPPGMNPDVAYMGALLKILEDNGVDDPNSALFWSASGNREHLGGGLYQNLKWKVGAKELELLKEYLDKATSGGKAAAEGTKEVCDWAIDEIKGGVWEQITSALGGGKNKELQELTKRVYDAMKEAEAGGQKINWDGFPFGDDMPDPRKKKDEGGGGSDDTGGGKGDNDGGGDGSGGDGNGSSGGDGSSGTTEPIPPQPKPIIDPSGFVYEAVESNRLADVTATVYEVDTNTGTRTPWAAGEYSQENPLVTTTQGNYQWFVPPGGWSVSFSKGGFENYTTGEHDGTDAAQAGGTTWYMPVAPVQLDVNIGMTSITAPMVESATATAEGVYLVFSRHMDTDTLTAGNFSLTVNGEDIDLSASVSFPDKETAPDGSEYARSVLLRHALGADAQVLLEVKAAVKSYAGVPMAVSYIPEALPVETLPQVASLSAAPASGAVAVNTSVTLSTDTEGAAIYYTTNGSAPSREGGKLYTGPILLDRAMTIKAVAVKAGCADSAVFSAGYTIQANTPPPPPPPGPPGVGGGGSVTQPKITANEGGKFTLSEDGKTLTITPDTGFRIKDVLLNGVSQGALTGLKGLKATDKVEIVFENISTGWVNPFTDVASGAWYYEAVAFVHQKGLFAGTGAATFSPETPMTRAMLVTVLWRLEGSPASSAVDFPDVSADSWYSLAVSWAAQKGIVKGYESGLFGPADHITREQMSAILYRYGGSPPAQGTLGAFRDGGQVSAFAQEAVKWALDAGLLTGMGGGVLAPQGEATRAQVAAMLQRYLNWRDA